MTRLVHSSLSRAEQTASIIQDSLRATSSASASPATNSNASPPGASAPVAPDEGIVADAGGGDTCPADNTTSPNVPQWKLSLSPTPPVAPAGALPVEVDPQLREGTPFMTEPILSHWQPSEKVRVRFPATLCT